MQLSKYILNPVLVWDQCQKYRKKLFGPVNGHSASISIILIIADADEKPFLNDIFSHAEPTRYCIK